MKTFKTPVSKIIFSASQIGKLMAGITKTELTDIQKAKVITLEAKKKTKGLTDKQSEELDKYYKKLNAKPELSQGGKTYVKTVWLKNEKGFYEDIQTKYTRKGNQAEDDSIKLISLVDNVMYSKNTERITKGHLTGECDINKFHKPIQKRIVDDAKSSFTPLTFMNSDFSTLYEWQGRAYMHLYEADIFRLRYCLVDCPPEVLIDELKKYCWLHNIFIQEDGNYLEQDQPKIDQFYANYIYSNNPDYTLEERIKTYAIERDLDKEKQMLEAIELAVEFYQTITLNMK